MRKIIIEVGSNCLECEFCVDIGANHYDCLIDKYVICDPAKPQCSDDEVKP